MTARRPLINWLGFIAAFTLMSVLVGCRPTENAPAQDGQSASFVPDLEAATPLPVTLSEVSETFALGSRSTDLQREELSKMLTGAVVHWPLQVYEVSADGDDYTVIVRPRPAADASAMNLMHVIAIVSPRSESDRALIRRLKTGDTITIKGRVIEVKMRAVIVINPAILETTP